MTFEIDTNFDVYSDTPEGKDPDSFSPTLRFYHRHLWSKPLPDGCRFELDVDRTRAYLSHQSDLGIFNLSSDAIGHTYRDVKSMAHIIQQVDRAEIDAFYRLASSVGAYIVFPSNRIDGKATINGARGLNHKIRDRFDLTLECIRRYYGGVPSPLTEVLERYRKFFHLFGNFRGYCSFFLLEDALKPGVDEIQFFLPFDEFARSPLPQNVDEYHRYQLALSNFIVARNERIQEFARNLTIA